MIRDKSVIFQIFGSLMKEPLLLSDTKYLITPDDFNGNFEKCIFGAIYNLAMQGAQKITSIDIDGYLQPHEGIYQNFQKNNGIEYLQDCEEVSNVENFDYYYNKFKKYNLLNDFVKQGFDIKGLYPEDILDKDYNNIMDNFEGMSIDDMVNFFKKKIAVLESSYQVGSDIEKKKANEGLQELLKQLKVSPEVGPPLLGKIYNTVCRGARRGKYFIRSALSGVGKTRSMVGDACNLAYPFRYNRSIGQWEYSGSTEKVLFIATEQSPDEIQLMIIAFLSGLNEEVIRLGLFENDVDEKVLSQTLQLIDYFQDNFKIVRISEPTIESIKAIVRQEVLCDDYSCVFFDYIFNNPSLIREFKDSRLREDVVLSMFSTALKDLAIQLNIFMQSSTQVTLNENERKGMKTMASLRGSKAIADKADMGCIISNVSEEDKEVIQEIVGSIGMMPNQVTDIYKLRGRYNNVRIWSYVDLGTCRKKDLFITDSNMQSIPGFKRFYKIDFENSGELDRFLLELNGVSVNEETGEVTEIDWNDLL
jgi:replicative DNA helicase